MTSEQARKLKYCPKCKKKKEIGLIVCWDCFKGPVTGFKYFTGSLTEFIKN